MDELTTMPSTDRYGTRRPRRSKPPATRCPSTSVGSRGWMATASCSSLRRSLEGTDTALWKGSDRFDRELSSANYLVRGCVSGFPSSGSLAWDSHLRWPLTRAGHQCCRPADRSRRSGRGRTRCRSGPAAYARSLSGREPSGPAASAASGRSPTGKVPSGEDWIHYALRV